MQRMRFELTHPLKEMGPEPIAFDQALPPLLILLMAFILFSELL